MVNGNDIGLAAVVCGSFVAVITTLARVFMNRHGTAPRVPPEVTQRLERMEQSIDSIAVEIERISEGQRFTTKLLADRVGEAQAPDVRR